MNDPRMSAIREHTQRLLTRRGYPGEVTLAKLPGGGNNRALAADLDGERFFVKVYFRDDHDQRDRLGAEYGFSTFAWENGVRMIPQPIAADPHHALGIYAYVEGRPLTPAEVDAARVRQAIDFIWSVNRAGALAAATHLPAASEACFSIDQHLQVVERRLQRLQQIQVTDAADKQAVQFIEQGLVPRWRAVTDTVRRAQSRQSTPSNRMLAAEKRIISPSDFGFHNVIRLPDDTLRFIDFEYAGWDDPAKLVCDFFFQPAVPVALDFLPLFESGLIARWVDANDLQYRIRLLFPVYQIKWCCILLNEFLPLGRKRRQFAGKGMADRKRLQLDKAVACLQKNVMERRSM